jgi:hypothetical protein
MCPAKQTAPREQCARRQGGGPRLREEGDAGGGETDGDPAGAPDAIGEEHSGDDRGEHDRSPGEESGDPRVGVLEPSGLQQEPCPEEEAQQQAAAAVGPRKGGYLAGADGSQDHSGDSEPPGQETLRGHAGQ